MPKKNPQNAAQGSGKTPEQPRQRLERERSDIQTTESTAYLRGLYAEFETQVVRYHELTAHMRELEARVELAEKTLSLTRDHLAAMIDKTEFAAPKDWAKTLNTVRYVGVRLMDACVGLLRTQGKLTLQEMV